MLPLPLRLLNLLLQLNLLPLVSLTGNAPLTKPDHLKLVILKKLKTLWKLFSNRRMTTALILPHSLDVLLVERNSLPN